MDIKNLRREGFSEDVLSAVECRTHRECETYEKFIEPVKTNPIADEVKIADLEDNMNIRRINKITAKDLKRPGKYHKSWNALTRPL